MLSNMDFCGICNGYDTIQVYVMHEGKFVGHICEKCAEKYKTDEERYNAMWGVHAGASSSGRCTAEGET